MDGTMTPATNGHVAYLHAMEAGIGFHHLYHVRKEAFGKQHTRLFAGAGDGHFHGFCSGRGAVVQRSIGHIQAGKGANKALILKDITQRPLRNLTLVRRIGSQKLRTRAQVRDDGRRVVVVRTGAHKHLEFGVHGLQGGKAVADFLLAHGGRKGIGPLVQELGGNVAVQIVQLFHADFIQHSLDIRLRMRQIR